MTLKSIFLPLNLSVALFSTIAVSADRTPVTGNPCAALLETTPERAQSTVSQLPSPVRGGSEFKSAQKVELLKPTRLELAPQSKLNAVIPIGKKQLERAHETRYAGFISFNSTLAGTYTIVASAGLWIEVIDPLTLKAADSDHHQMSKGCPPFRKAVAFQLEANKNYLLQLTGNGAPEAHLLVMAPIQ